MQVDEQCARSQKRHESKATALVTMERDRMRAPIHGHADDIAVGGVTLLLPTKLAVHDNLLVELENPIQRFTVGCKARVINVHPAVEGGFRIGCLLMPQLAARDVQLLKSNQIAS